MKEAVLKLYGDVGEPMLDIFDMGMNDSVSSTMVSEFLDDNKDAEKIVVRINSRGGDVQEGWAIYDLLTNSGKKIKTVGEGKIYSIATIIFLAGDEREMMKNADGLIHNPYIPPYTLADKYESNDLLKIAEGLQQEEEKILNFYVEKTGSDKSKLAEYMKEDTKLSAQDMLDLGFATKILEPVKAYAVYKPKSFNMTNVDEKAFFEKLGNALDKAVTKIAGMSRLPKAMKLTDKDGNEFDVERETGAPEVGDSATPDGTYSLEDGTTIVVSEGKISSIETPDVEDKDDEELVALKAERDKLAEDLQAANAKLEEIETSQAELETQTAEAKKIIDELKALKNSYKPQGRTKLGTVDKVGDVDLNRVREIRNNFKSE
jgi:ATP-dependent Clp protease protease subunit